MQQRGLEDSGREGQQGPYREMEEVRDRRRHALKGGHMWGGDPHGLGTVNPLVKIDCSFESLWTRGEEDSTLSLSSSTGTHQASLSKPCVLTSCWGESCLPQFIC